MNPLKQLLDAEETRTAVELKVIGLEALALEAFRRLGQSDQVRCVAALHDGAEPVTCEFVWTALLHAGLGRLALQDSIEPRSMPDFLFVPASRDVGFAFPAAPQIETTEDTERTEKNVSIPDGFVLTAENGAKAALSDLVPLNSPATIAEKQGENV